MGKKKDGGWLTDEVLDDQDSRPPSDYQPDPNDRVPDYLQPDPPADADA